MKKVVGVFFKILGAIIRFFGKLSNYILFHAYKYDFKKFGKKGHIGKNFKFKNVDCIEIGDNFTAGNGLILEAWKKYKGQSYTPQLKIGNNVIFTNNIQISCAERIEIGNNVLLGGSVFITDNDHGSANDIALSPSDRPLNIKGPVYIGNNVWLGRNVVVLSGVSIGENCIIGANSVVTKSIPDNCVVAGVPAKVIKDNSKV